jgi:hypothetical protein
MQTIFGGSKSKTSNQAYPWAQSTFGSGAGTAFNGGTSALEGLLGIGGDPAQSKAALDNFWKSTGGDFLLKQGTDAVNSNFYSRGLGQSGAAMKGLEDYRQGLASTKLNDLMQNYLGLAKLGLGAGDLVTSAGQQSSGSQSQGIASTIGALLAFA